MAAVAMALLATLAAYPSGSWRDAGSPYGIPWEETQGAPLLSGRPSLDPVGFSPSRYLPALERGSPGGQAVALSDLESQMREAINGERTKAGLPPLAIDERLVDLARERSQDMMTR
ncbi:MAG: CAP domain-containing protein, partial [Anaerolineae bacterium]